MSERRRISSGGPYEAVAGYSRAIVVGDGCWVAGTTDAGPDGRSTHPGDVAAQARAGFGLADVVRTRMFVTDISAWEAIAGVHGEVFGAIRPAATMVEVRALIDPSLLIEAEAEARRG